MKNKTNSFAKLLGLIAFVLLISSKSHSQTPCWEIRNHTGCPITISWETVDGGNNHIDGANPVNMSSYSSLYITGAACSGAANIYVYLFTIDGQTTNQIAPVDGISNTSESGTASTGCNSGTWQVIYGGGVIHIH